MDIRYFCQKEKKVVEEPTWKKPLMQRLFPDVDWPSQPYCPDCKNPEPLKPLNP